MQLREIEYVYYSMYVVFYNDVVDDYLNQRRSYPLFYEVVKSKN